MRRAPLLLLFLVCGCAHQRPAPPTSQTTVAAQGPSAADARISVLSPLAPTPPPPPPAPTCLVLSVGGAKGMAHIGAIDALKASRIHLDCVYGNSMGAVVGSLFASAPDAPLRQRYRELISQYVRETAAVKTGSLAMNHLLEGVRTAISRGAGWSELLSALKSDVSEAIFSETFDNARFQRVLNHFLHEAKIEALPMKFATSYQTLRNQGLDFGVITQGSVAEAVARSANNPFIFKNTSLAYVDPGSDRSASTPVEDACALVPGARLIVINVSGSPARYRQDNGCEVHEVLLPEPEGAAEAIKGEGAAFEAIYRRGFELTQALVRASLAVPGS